MNIPEILAPAGSAEALKAAVRCGAAAVYLGADGFNARQHAANFAGDALQDAVAYCHTRGVQVHLTLNTLVREREMADAMALARRAAAYGVDALIVQDVGLARRLHAAAPALPLHASTQLSCHTPEGVRFLRDNGFSRVVLAREMSREEIRACAGLGCELEVFVHGALCMCVSGQCYLSAALGGRSGNRGLCAQPCRLPFSAPGTPGLTGSYALSLKDNSLVRYIPELVAAGVTSFKIEGRMKRPEYVAAATTVCRLAAQGQPIPPQLDSDLKTIFSRSGFTDGYYTGKRHADMFGVRQVDDLSVYAPALKRLRDLYAKERQSVPVTLHLIAAAGKPTALTAADTDGHTVTVYGGAAETAHTAATTPERVIQQLCKTGDTPFCAAATAELSGNVILPAAAINALRRDALAQISAKRAALRPVAFVQTTEKLSAPAAPSYPRILRLADPAQYHPVMAADTVILPLSTPVKTLRALQTTHRGTIGIEIPRGLFGNTAAIQHALRAAKDAGAEAALCGNIGALPLAQNAGLQPIGGIGLHATNSDAVTFFAENGVRALLLSPELSLPQTRFSAQAAIPCGVFLYGRLPLMLTRNCPRAMAGQDCKSCHGDGVLTDRKHARFPIVCQNGCAELLNTVPRDWADKQAALPPHLFAYFHFTVENSTEAAAVLQRYADGIAADTPITRGMLQNGVL